MPEDQNILLNLKRYSMISKKIDSLSKELEIQMGGLKLNVVDGFKPYIHPKRNIDNLMSFYSTFISTKDLIEMEQSKLNEIFGEAKDGLSPRDLRMLKEKSVMISIQSLIDGRDTLRKYENVRMVESEIRSVDEFIRKIMDVINESFFMALSKVPEQDPELQEFASFLILNTDKRMFISRYTNVVYSKLGFDDIGMNTKLLLERASNLIEFFSNIIEMNDRVLGEENSKITNVGLLKMFVIGLKRVIADNLIRIEREEDIRDVPFLITLNSRLKSTMDRRIKVLDELLVFKDNINKIICNCISGYFEKLDMLMEPNGCRDTEPLCLKIVDILDAFYDHKSVAEVFVEAYGSTFSLNTTQDIFMRIGGKTVEKILLLAESLRGISKSVYIVNNLHVFTEYLNDVDGISIDDMIKVNLEDISGIWRNEISKRTEDDITVFLNKNIENQSKYFLPERLRDQLMDEINESIEDELERKRYSGDINELRTNIKGLYSAKHN